MSESTLASIEIANLDLNFLNRKFEKAEPKRILAWCVANFPTKLVQNSTFNIDDLVITDLLYRELHPVKPVPVVFVDTLYHFRETLELVDRAQAIYNLDLRICKIAGVNSRDEFVARYGAALWEKDIQRFDYLTKQEPLQQGLAQLNAMVVIKACSPNSEKTNTAISVFERDIQGRLQVNPLSCWSRTESWAYAYEYDLIYNPLHDEGYARIGDEPLTSKKVTMVPQTDKLERLRGMLKTPCIYSI